MSYAGNPSLSSDIQKRVLGTFEQTLGLAAEGNRQEALLGCDFVLRMDPQFEPARRLQERMRDTVGPVRVDDLLAPAADPFDLDLPDLPAFGAPATPAAPSPGDLRGRFQSLLEARRFQELLTLAHQDQATVGRDPELMKMATAAQERMEAEPYVNKFLAAAQEAARLGQRDEVERLSAKIRALDSSHPGLAALSVAPAPAAQPETSFADLGAGDAGAMGFEMSFDDPAGSLDLPDLSFDTSSLDLDEPLAAPSLMDPELVSAADFATSMGSVAGIGDMGGGDSESDRRIRELLGEGQRAHDNGDLQGAIDAWSRIFLIDIDHQEAARRIEQARKLKAESERQAEEVFHEGVSKIEAGDLQGAKQAFQRVLEIQPGYFAARDYLQQLEAGTVPTVKPMQRETSAQSALPLPSDLDLDGGGDLKEEILIPPDPSEVAAAERQRPKPRPAGAPARQGRARKLFVVVGSIVLVLALAGGAFVYLNRGKLFPNSQTDESVQAGPAIADTIGRATELQKSGKTQSALAQLKRIPPSDPSYQRAQELIKEWSVNSQGGLAGPAGTETPGATPAPGATPTPPPISAERLAILTAARDAYVGGRYLEAARRFEQASAQGQLDPSDAEMLASAKRQTEPLAAQLDLFRQHEWEHVLRDLWRMHESDPSNRDVTRLMVDSYYNMGLRDLQRMDSAKAVENFREAIGLDPNDKSLKRQLAFAQTYEERPKDLLYRIYVKHLPVR